MKVNEVVQAIDEAAQNIGILIDDYDDEIINYIADSLYFINFIIQIEEKLNMEFPDDMLMMDRLGTVHALAEKLVMHMEQGITK